MNASALQRAAQVFDFTIPEWLNDEVVVGKICGVNVCAGELRRLSKALHEMEEANPHDDHILKLLKRREIVAAIRFRRMETNEGLLDAKTYVENIGERHGLRSYNSATNIWSWA